MLTVSEQDGGQIIVVGVISFSLDFEPPHENNARVSAQSSMIRVTGSGLMSAVSKSRPNRDRQSYHRPG